MLSSNSTMHSGYGSISSISGLDGGVVPIGSSVTQPYRKPFSHNSRWPSISERTSTPSLVRAARARALSTSVSSNGAPNDTVHLNRTAPEDHEGSITQKASNTHVHRTSSGKSADKLANNIINVGNSNGSSSNGQAINNNNAGANTGISSFAQQMHARALAAQAAHQERLAVNQPAAPQLLPSVVLQVRPATGISAPSGKFNSASGLHSGSSFSIIDDTDLEEYVSLMDDIQVDLSLPIVESDSPRFDHNSNNCFHSPSLTQIFTSPSAQVDISAFLPPPGPPVLIADDKSIAASAVPFAHWAADLVHLFLQRPIGPKSPASEGFSMWFNSLIDDSCNLGRHSRFTAAPAPFRAFVQSTLSATLPSPQCLFLGLFFLSKLPIGRFDCVPPELNNVATPPGVRALFASLNSPSWTPAELAFRQAVYGEHALQFSSVNEPNHAQHIFSLALMLANKWLEDNTFTTNTWHDVTSLPQERLKTVETAALNTFGFCLAFKDSEWSEWLSTLRSYTSSLVAKEPIGVVNTVNTAALKRIDQLSQLTTHPSDDLGIITSDTAVNTINRLTYSPPSLSRTFSHHSRTDSLPSSAMESDVNFHSSSRANQNMEYQHRRAWSVSDSFDPFQMITRQSNVTIPSASRMDFWPIEADESDVGYRWEQVQAEREAREFEQEMTVRSWPHPLNRCRV